MDSRPVELTVTKPSVKFEHVVLAGWHPQDVLNFLWKSTCVPTAGKGFESVLRKVVMVTP